MKKLIFPLLTLLSFNSFADLGTGEMDGPLSNGNLKKKMVTEIKELEVERILKGTKEFQKCREKNKFEATLKDDKRQQQLQAATDCFNDELKNVKGDQLQELSRKLELENYGIVKSKNSQDISKYLSKKMAKALTGYDPNDPATLKESRKWKNQKILDQSMFLNLYQAQLAKSALLETSRFCFQNLRKLDSAKAPILISGKNFQVYWGGTVPTDPADLTDIADDQYPNITIAQDLSKTDEVYKAVQDSIGTADINAKFMNDFLTVCMSSIKVMCDDFKKGVQASAASPDDKILNEEQIKTDAGSTSNLKRGSNSCLTMNRMASLRKAVTQTDIVVKEMEKLNSEEDKLSLVMDANVFVPGQNGNASIDELTSASGMDLISEMEDDKAEEKQKKCAQDATSDECQQYLQEGDSYYKALHSTEMEMNLKREVARRQIKELKEKNDAQKIEEWLVENGFPQEAEAYKKDPKTVDLDKIVIQSFEARKQAEIETLKKRVGSRQMKDKEGKDTSDGDRSTAINSAVQDSHEERARLAQVVMFNNIITSYLDVKKDGKSVGRNVTGLKKEMEAMEKSGASGKFFENIKQTVADEDKGATKDSNISGLDIIDVVLGKTPEDQTKP